MSEAEQCVLLAEYLAAYAAHAALGARLRTKYKKDDDWTIEEEDEFAYAMAQTRLLWRKLPNDAIACVQVALLTMDYLCDGELPR